MDNISYSFTILFSEYHISPQNVIDFLEEATIMKDFNHDHVLSMYGVIIDENNRVYVLLPYMANGDLKAYVADDHNVSSLKYFLSIIQFF